MRLLLDECLPKRLRKEFEEHDVKTVPEMGWAGKKNGELFRLMQGRFAVFVTGDQNLRYQQNLRKWKVAVLLLATGSNRLGALKPLMPKVRAALSKIQPGQFVRIST